MRKHPFLAAFVIATLASTAFLGCGTDNRKDGDSLDIENSPVPSPFHVGDTSGFWIVSKTVILATGRADKTDNYATFHLVSSDSDVVGIVLDGHRVTGRKEGSAEVKAVDDKSGLISQSSVKVTVAAP